MGILADMAKAKAAGQPMPKAVSSGKVKRLSDRRYTLTATFADGTSKTYHIGHNSVNTKREWFRLNHPTAKIIIEEVQTYASSDGKTSTKLTFKSQPKISRDPNGQILKINCALGKVNTEIDFPTHAESTHKYAPRITERANAAKAEALYNASLTKHNGKAKVDRNIRLYSNATGRLILSTESVEVTVDFMSNLNFDFTDVTIYLPAYLHSKFMAIVER
jgi:hypothetical protein